MTVFEEIEAGIDLAANATDPAKGMASLLALGEDILEHWVRARGEIPTEDQKEGFRLLALHRQGARGEPSFNACRETCRELAYHYNLIAKEPEHPEVAKRLTLARMVARHLCYFVGGKMEVEKLGEFCCSSRPIRTGGNQSQKL
ncbi:MAG: hypothetical protein ACR2OX_12495 [Methyloligellaceae bacterium]